MALKSRDFLHLTLILCAFTAGSSCTGIRRVATVYSKDSTFDAESQRVLIISFDGLRPDAIAAAGAAHLLSMQDAGAYSLDARTVVPPITLVSHTSMLTGVSPDKHGILWNSYIPERGTVGVTTIFEQAKKKGLTTAMVVGKDKFRHLNRPGSLDAFEIDEGSQASVAEEAITVFKKYKPALMFVHFRHADTAGHADGWMGPEQLAAIADADQGLGHILNALSEMGLLSSTTVIATADHGGEGFGHGSGAVAADMTIPWIAVGPEIPVRGAIAQAITTFDTAATAAQILDLEIPSAWDGRSALIQGPPAYSASK